MPTPPAQDDLDIVEDCLETGAAAPLRSLLDRGLRLDELSGSETFLHRAASYGHTAIAQLLLSRGFNKDYLLDGVSPLHDAAQSHHRATLKLLLEWGANPEQADPQGRRPIHLVFTDKDECPRPYSDELSECLECLIEHGANINARDMNGFSVVHYATRAHLEPVLRGLLDSGADIEMNDIYGRTALHFAASQPNDSIVRLLLDRGANMEATDRINCRPIHYAVMRQRRECVQQLISRRANLRAGDGKGRAAIHIAASHNSTQLLELLARNGVSLDQYDARGRSPLHYAAEFNRPEALEWLLRHGANVNSRDREGATPVCLSLFPYGTSEYRFDERSVKLLLEGGADLDLICDRAFSNMTHFNNSSKEGTINSSPVVNQILRDTDLKYRSNMKLIDRLNSMNFNTQSLPLRLLEIKIKTDEERHTLITQAKSLEPIRIPPPLTGKFISTLNVFELQGIIRFNQEELS